MGTFFLQVGEFARAGFRLPVLGFMLSKIGIVILTSYFVI